MKKLFFTLCALCLCGTMWGQDTKDSTYGLYYELDADYNATIVAVPEGETAYSNDNLASYTSIEGAVTIPAEVDGYSVVAVGASAFDNATISETLVIPAYITTVGAGAFMDCANITTVIFEESDKALNDENTAAYTSMFYGSHNIKYVEMYRNIDINYGTNVVGGAFAYQWYLEEVIFGAKVTSIPVYMFRSYFNTGSLIKVTSYAENPPTIGNGAFDRHADGLTLYTPYDYLNNYRLDDDWISLFGSENMHALGDDGDPEWPVDELAFLYDGIWYEPIYEEDGVTETGEAQIIADQGGEVYAGEITIPETVINSETGTSYTVTRIDENAFANSRIEGEVVIPANILNMGKQAFYNCTGIKTVTYEYSPTALHEENTGNGSGGSFSGCTGVTTVNMYRDITWTTAGNQNSPFLYVGTMSTVNIGPRVTSIYTHFFRNGSSATSLKTVNCYSANPASLASDALGVVSGLTINVPQGSVEAYEEAWTEYNSTSTYASTIQEMDNAYAVTISDAAALDGSYYATYYNDNAVDIYPQGGTLSDGSVYDATTYAATGVEVEGTTAYLDLVEVGATVPAGVAVLVDGNAAGTYTVIETTAAKDASYNGENDLYGFLESNEYYAVAPDEGSYYFYKLTLDSGNDEGSLGFYWGADEGVAFLGEANKAYLVLTQGALQGLSAVKLKKGEGDNDTTGISSVENATEGAIVKGIYTIQGVRVSNMNQPGLYIVDGKKVLVK